MLADSDRLLNTVEQCSRPGALPKADALNISEIELGSLLSESIDTVQTRHNLDPSAIKYTAPNEEIRVSGDRDGLHSAFLNLLDNAVKYSGGDPKISVRLKNSTLTNKAEIYIRDSGVGIAPGELKRVFKRFSARSLRPTP